MSDTIEYRGVKLARSKFSSAQMKAIDARLDGSPSSANSSEDDRASRRRAAEAFIKSIVNAPTEDLVEFLNMTSKTRSHRVKQQRYVANEILTLLSDLALDDVIASAKGGDER